MKPRPEKVEVSHPSRVYVIIYNALLTRYYLARFSYFHEGDWNVTIRADSKSTALLAVFTSIIVALEIFPIPGLTDFYTPVPNFTIDWTGIPIVIIFLGLGIVYSFFSIIIMWIFIGYRNFQGAAFKGLAETFTVIGLIAAKLVLRNRELDWKKTAIVYFAFACMFRAVGMYFGNAFLFNFFWSMPIEAAFNLSIIYVPWNIVQATINVVIGVFLYQMIPESLRVQAGLGRFRNNDQNSYEEISEDELNK